MLVGVVTWVVAAGLVVAAVLAAIHSRNRDRAFAEQWARDVERDHLH